jgi:hypothetical protein
LVANDLRPEISAAVQEEVRAAMAGLNKTLKEQKDHIVEGSSHKFFS